MPVAAMARARRSRKVAVGAMIISIKWSGIASWTDVSSRMQRTHATCSINFRIADGVSRIQKKTFESGH